MPNSALFAMDVGSLAWTQKTGGALTNKEKAAFVLDGLAHILGAYAAKPFSPKAKKVDLAKLAPPASGIVNEAATLLKEKSHPAMVNHCFRTAYWTLAVMKNKKPELSAKEIEEAWIAALLHDIGLDLPPAFGEFTLGGVKIVQLLSQKHGWDKNSAHRASEAITLNPNSYVKRKFGLLAWAMNTGGYGETSLGPYRTLMHPDNIIEVETLHPRKGFYLFVPKMIGKELLRFPNQRFAILKKIGFVARRLKD